MKKPERIVFLIDTIPIRDGGVGGHSLGWTIKEVFQKYFSVLLVTHQGRSWVDLDSFRRTVSTPYFLYPDFSRLGLRRISNTFRECLDSLCFIASLPFLLARLKKHQADRIFVYSSNSWPFIVNGWLLKKLSGLPTDLYLVDDLEASAALNGQTQGAPVTRWVEDTFLKKYDRLFLISDGFIHHLKRKYGFHGQLLPIVIREPIRVCYSKHEGDFRWIGYLGSINGMYESALNLLADAIVSLNTKSQKPVYGIRFFTRKKSPFIFELEKRNVPIEVVLDTTPEELLDGLSRNYANFLPYSFRKEDRTMVCTAFSSKTSDYLLSGRPILAFGPQESSTVSHFLKNEIPLVCFREDGIEDALSALEEVDSPQLIEIYQRLINQYHSSEAFLKYFLMPSEESFD